MKPLDRSSPRAELSRSYRIASFELHYLHEQPDLPALADLMATPITLSRDSTDHWRVPAAGLPTQTMTLTQWSSEERVYEISGVQQVLEQLRDALTSRQLMGLFVSPDARDVDESGLDRRPVGSHVLRLVLTVARITQLRTIASGERVPEDRRIDAKEHARIRRMSPLDAAEDQAAETGDTARRTALLRRDLIDDYVYWLSRHPGRRADVAIAPSMELGGVTLDYLITENRPWSLYAQFSNTGTLGAHTWREEFGFFHHQLTGHDDSFAIEYGTTDFEDVHSVQASYESPLGDARRFRYRVESAWSTYTASDIGLFNDTFKGQSWSLAGQGIFTIHQHRNLFVDAILGLRYFHTRVSNTLPGSTDGDEGFIIPSFTLAAEQRSEWYSLAGRVSADWQSDMISDVEPGAVNNLGRLGVNTSWLLLRWETSASVYLEPLLDHAAWADPTTPRSSTLAHELWVSFRGQHSFDARLIPQMQGTLGGMWTVRGYPETTAAADSILLFTAEYRYHVPRDFAINADAGSLFGQPFRWAPQYVYGQPDWDLILRAFIDVGTAINQGGAGLPGESDQTLIGVGVGGELVIKRNLRLRVDYGIALTDVDDRAKAGDSRLHLAVTVLW